MNLSERLEKIGNAKVKMDAKKADEIRTLDEKKEVFRTKLMPYASRIQDLLTIARALMYNKIPLGKCTHNGPLIKYEFVTEGIGHKFGFFIPYSWNHSQRGMLIGLGYMGGGACGNDLVIDEQGIIVQWSDYMFQTRYDRLESDFLAFEKAVLDYVDNL